MNEAETRAEFIDPALREKGWGVVEDSKGCIYTDGFGTTAENCALNH